MAKNGWGVRPQDKKETPVALEGSPAELLERLATRREEGSSERAHWVQAIYSKLRHDEAARQRIYEAFLVLPDDVLHNLCWILDVPGDVSELQAVVTLAIHQRSIQQAGPPH